MNKILLTTLFTAQAKYDSLDLNITYKEYISTIFSNVINITNLQIEKQKLTIENKIIDLDIVKDEYKVIEDVKILENTKNIRTINLKLNNLNIQNQILSLYFNYL